MDPLVITPRILAVPRQIDGSACLLFPAAEAQLRFSVILAGDGTPVSVEIPRQIVILSPERWLPVQLIRILVTLSQSSKSGINRRYWFRCPGKGCKRRVDSLFLDIGPLPEILTRRQLAERRGHRRSFRFLCRNCIRAANFMALPCLSHPKVKPNYDAARDPFTSGYSLRTRLKALPTWYRWQTEGRRGYPKTPCIEGEAVKPPPQ